MGAWRFLSWWNGRNGGFFQSCWEPGSFDSFQRKCEIREIPYQKLWSRVSGHRWKFSLCANSRRLCPRRNFFYRSQWFWVRDPCPFELRIWGFDLFGGPRQACHQQVRCAREFRSSSHHRYTQWRTFLRWPSGRCMCSSWCPSRANLCGDYRRGRIWSSGSSSSLDLLIGLLRFLVIIIYSFYAFWFISWFLEPPPLYAGDLFFLITIKSQINPLWASEEGYGPGDLLSLQMPSKGMQTTSVASSAIAARFSGHWPS